MINEILSNYTAGITDLKKNPSELIKKSNGQPIAILNRNKPEFYCIPSKLYEQILDRLEDIELGKIADSRKNDPTIEVKIEGLENI